MQVPDGTMATSAVLLFFNQRRVLNKLLGNYRGMMERVSNRLFLTSCVGTLYAWVREGDDEDKKNKLAIFRNLGGDLESDLEHYTAYRYVYILYTHHMSTLYAHIICPHYMSTPYRIIEFLV